MLRPVPNWGCSLPRWRGPKSGMWFSFHCHKCEDYSLGEFWYWVGRSRWMFFPTEGPWGWRFTAKHGYLATLVSFVKRGQVFGLVLNLRVLVDQIVLGFNSKTPYQMLKYNWEVWSAILRSELMWGLFIIVNRLTIAITKVVFLHYFLRLLLMCHLVWPLYGLCLISPQMWLVLAG